MEQINYRSEIIHVIIKNILKESINKSIKDDSLPEIEMDALTNICMMGASAITGTETPHEYMRAISDRILKYFVENIDEISKNPIINKIRQFFMIEWCYRHSYLNDDWIWVWKTNREGQLMFNPKIPLNEINFHVQ